MRNAILIDPNYFESIKDDSTEIDKNLNKIKEILQIDKHEFLIYWIDDNQETLKKSYQELIKKTLDPKLKILIEFYYQNLTCEKINSDLGVFKIGKNLRQDQLKIFLRDHSYIKLFLTNIKKIDTLDTKDIQQFIDLGKINLEKLNNVLAGLFRNLSSITFSDPFIIVHTFNFMAKLYYNKKKFTQEIQENPIYDQNLKQFKEIKRSEAHNKDDYINTLQHLLSIIFKNNTNFENIKIKFLTSYHDKSRAMKKYIKDFEENNNAKISNIHNEVKDKLLKLLGVKDNQANIVVKIVAQLNNDKKYEFYKRTIKLEYKSGKRMTVMVENGLNFLQGERKKLKTTKIGNYSFKLLDPDEAQKYDNYQFHDEFISENEEKSAQYIQSKAV
ncbi:hypothetical protein OAP04_01150 [Pelagibacteraceae bacterium]|nr:hypothetical protein [Pelagibacteraceae bacterium]